MPAALAASADALAQIVVPPAPKQPPPLHLDPAAVDRVVAEVADVLSADLRAQPAAAESPNASAVVARSSDNTVPPKPAIAPPPPRAESIIVPGAAAGLSGSTDFGELASSEPSVEDNRAELAEVTSANTTKAQPDLLPALAGPGSAHLSDQNGATASTDEILSSNRIAEVRSGTSDADDSFASQASVAPRTGYQPDDDKRWTVYYLAGWMALFSLFSMAPALPYWNLGAAPRWAQAVLLLSVLQLAYVVWVASIPDWATLWSSMILFTAIAALYGAMMTISLSTPLEQALPLDLSDIRRETPLWCAGVMLLSFLLAYLCGRAAWRWRRTFELLHA